MKITGEITWFRFGFWRGSREEWWVAEFTNQLFIKAGI